MEDVDFQQWAAQGRRRIEALLEQAVRDRAPGVVGRGDAVLHEAMGYGVLGGGKRIRALLTLAAGEATGHAIAQQTPEVGGQGGTQVTPASQ